MGSLHLESSYNLEASLKQYSSVWKHLHNTKNPLLDSEVEEKDLRSPTPPRTPKLKLAAEQPSTGECWISPKKDTQVQGQRRSPSKTVWEAKSCLQSKPHTRQRCRAQTKPCVHQDPEIPQRLSQTCLSMFESLLWGQGAPVACHGHRDWLQQTWEAKLVV